MVQACRAADAVTWLAKLREGIVYGRPASARHRTGVLIGAVLLAGSIAVLAGASAFSYYIIEGREVGPDAGQMAKDPVLHVEIDGASPEEISTDNAREGGIMPTPANRTSTASRNWTLADADWHGPLQAAVGEVDEHGITWSGLSCSSSSVTFRGVKQVATAGEVVRATVGVAVHHTDGHDPYLRIVLRSKGTDSRSPGPPQLRVDDECPPEVSETFTSLQA